MQIHQMILVDSTKNNPNPRPILKGAKMKAVGTTTPEAIEAAKKKAEIEARSQLKINVDGTKGMESATESFARTMGYKSARQMKEALGLTDDEFAKFHATYTSIEDQNSQTNFAALMKPENAEHLDKIAGLDEDKMKKLFKLSPAAFEKAIKMDPNQLEALLDKPLKDIEAELQRNQT
jgi:hypothetical protein